MCSACAPSGAKLKRVFLLMMTVVALVSLALYVWLSGHLPSEAFKERFFSSRPSLAVPPQQTSNNAAVTLVQKTLNNSAVSLAQQTVNNAAVTAKVNQSTADGQKCVHPPLDLHDPGIMQHYAKERPVNCSSAMMDWVYVINGTLHISQDAIRQYGNFSCEYSPIFRQGDYAIRYGAKVKPLLNGTRLQSDFFRISCVSAKGKNYTYIHASVAWNSVVMKRLRDYRSSTKSTNHMSKDNSPTKANTVDHGPLNLSILMLGFDSVSRMGWHRNLPKSHKYFTEKMGAIELENYNIMGGGTACALLPMLTGKKKEELPEARPGVSGGKPVDNYPWIWKELSKNGYVTAFAQDKPGIGAFHYNMRGFQNQPTDHYIRPFYQAAEKARLSNPPLCWGSTPRHVYFMNWFGSLMDMYRDFPKFFFGHYLEMSHDHTNRLQAADDDLVKFLQGMELKGYLNSTLMILMADHGPRFAHIRQTAQGVLEGRLPYFAFRFPPWVHKRHPEIIKNMRINTQRLTTPLDIHATFQDILNYSTNTEKANIRNRAISLFKEIPRERTCTDAAITPHWCACLVWHPVNRSDPLVRKAAEAAVNTINSYTQSFRTKCAKLTLQKITDSVLYEPSSEDRAAELRWVKFDKRNSPPLQETVRYRVSFKTLPGEGHYEVTCELDVKSKKFSVKEGQISRINKYGSQPACVMKTKPHLRPYCYCN